MKTLDRYLARELAVPFLVALAGFELMMLGNLLYLYLPMIRQAGLPAATICQVLLLRAPEVAGLGIPFSVLVATAWGLQRLARESEITAMRMGGVSVRRLLVPVLGVGLVASVFAFLNSEYLAPTASHQAEGIMRRALVREPGPLFREHTFLRVPPNMYIYVHRVEPATRRFFDILVYELSGERYPLVTTAREGSWDSRSLLLREGVRHKYRADGTFEREERFREARINLGTAISALLPEQKTSREMSSRELADCIATFRRSGLVVREMELDYAFKFSLPLAAFICTLVAAPLALRHGRGGNMAGLLLAFVLAFLYQVLMAWSRSLGAAGTLPPVAAAWSQNGVFAGAGLYLLARQE